MPIYIFCREEKKYLLSPDEQAHLLSRLSERITPDAYPHNTIASEYLDTSDFRIIRASMDGGVYREKLRIRSYGRPRGGDPVFFEIKKKYKGIVYKRRVQTPYAAAHTYLAGGSKPTEGQIMDEIDHAMRVWERPQPRVLLAYERDAYFLRDFPAVRLTFDSAVRYRTESPFLTEGTEGKIILPPDKVIAEIKTEGGMPLFLSHLLDELHIYPTRFSKYKTAYLDILKQERKND
ncbi:MAG: polyphosphate polymerase domain-containing protein [Clostridia bacterium]|nr:polyphosphate polymerase domain-containing protein [Clostridia bacterium]